MIIVSSFVLWQRDRGSHPGFGYWGTAASSRTSSTWPRDCRSYWTLPTNAASSKYCAAHSLCPVYLPTFPCHQSRTLSQRILLSHVRFQVASSWTYLFADSVSNRTGFEHFGRVSTRGGYLVTAEFVSHRHYLACSEGQISALVGCPALPAWYVICLEPSSGFVALAGVFGWMLSTCTPRVFALSSWNHLWGCCSTVHGPCPFTNSSEKATSHFLSRTVAPTEG